LLTGGAAVAQPRPAAPAPPVAAAGDHRTPDQLRKEVLERMRALRAWKIVEALKLDEATSARLFPILSRYDEREMAIAAERHVIMRDLREATEAAHPDDARLTATLNKLQAKLVLLLPRMEHDFAGWIHEASGRGGGPGPGGDDP
jgi:hypothetical protein